MRPRPFLTALCMAIVAAAPPPGALHPAAPSPATPDEYAIAAAEMEPPAEVPATLAAHLQRTAISLLGPEGQSLMDLWPVATLPPATGLEPTFDVSYNTIPVGAFLGVMRLRAEHIDYRDQTVAPGVYLMRYLQQPLDGEHIGITIFRDFAVLNPLTAAGTPEPEAFDPVLARALQLNPHPYVWGLWPAAEVPVAEPPGIAAVDDKWVVVLLLPREAGDPLALALVVVGSEPPEGY